MSSEPDTSIVRVWPQRGPYVRTTSPLILPSCICARCGADDPAGQLRNDIVYHVSGWIYFTAVISLFVFLLCYYTGRKGLEVQYYLCPKCADRRKIRVASALTTALVAAIITLVAVSMGDVMTVFYGICVFAGATLASTFFQSAPMKALTFDGSHFSVKGIADEATAELQKKLPPEAQ